MAIKFTDEQNNAINASGTVLVSAAAGSGKTAVLVERIIRKFCDETSPVMADRALIVTFTNAAAAELKGKIEEKLAEKLSESPSSSLLKQQNLLIKTANICTIDSFCISLVRENFNLLNISRDFKIADSTDLNIVYSDILDTMLSKKYFENDPTLLRALTSMQSKYDDSKLKDIIFKFYSKSCAMPYQREWIESTLDNLQNDDFTESEYFKSIFSNAQILIDKAIDANNALLSASALDDKFYDKYYDKVNEYSNILEKILNYSCTYDWDNLYGILQSSPTFSLRTNYSKDIIVSLAIKDAADTYKNALTELKKYFQYNLSDTEYIMNKFKVVLSDITSLTTDYLDAVTEHFNSKNAYTFDQIEHMALDLISSNESVVDNFNKQYDMILVDEYQDTSNLQDELFRLLSTEKGQLFMVGDVKQSIYGFRNANPKNFLYKSLFYPKYPSDSKECKVLLRGNFRSRKEICDYVNYLFSSYMTAFDADINYDSDEALVPLAKYAQSDDNKVEILLSDCPNGERVSVYEAKCIAKYIIDILNKDPFIDDGNGNLRKATFSDIVILMRSPKNTITDLVKVFRSVNIPISMPAEKFSDSLEIANIISFLKAADNTNDSIALLNTMKSPVFNFSDDEIAEIMLHDKKVNLYFNLNYAASCGNEKAKEVISFIKRVTSLISTLPLNEVLTEIYADTGIVEIYDSLDVGSLKKANLRLLLDYAKEYGRVKDKTLDDFVNFIEKNTNNSPSANIIESSDSVKVMSIHNSKGLQFPICIIASLSKSFNERDTYDKFVYDDELGVAFDFYDDTTNSILSPISKRCISQNLKIKLFKEELRLLYVALTRACQKLSLVITNKNLEKVLENATKNAALYFNNELPLKTGALTSVKSFAEWILVSALCHSDGVAFRRGGLDFEVVPFDCNFTVSKIEPIDTFQEIKLVKADENTKVDMSYLKEVLSYSYPHEYINLVPAKTSVTDILGTQKPIDLILKSRPSFMSSKGLTPQERGTATHKFMEYCNFESAISDLEEEIERLYEWQYISKNEAEAIDRESINAFFVSSAYGHILKSNKIYREYQFISKINANQLNDAVPEDINEYSIIQGVADCIVENDNDIIIIDYKTDNNSDEHHYINEYSRQLALYSTVLEEIFSKPVSKKIIYSFKLKKCIEV